MMRTQIPNKVKEFVRWSQKDTCFLCSFPLVIYCHFHHIISVENHGPEDQLNLIGLCANHHGMIENLRRTNHPSLSKLGTNDPKVRKWAYKIDAVKKLLNSMNSTEEKITNLLLEPYFLEGNESDNVFNHDPHLNIGIARMIINKNMELWRIIRLLKLWHDSCGR